jgi:hypothetical protein
VGTPISTPAVVVAMIASTRMIRKLKWMPARLVAGSPTRSATPSPPAALAQ